MTLLTIVDSLPTSLVGVKRALVCIIDFFFWRFKIKSDREALGFSTVSLVLGLGKLMVLLRTSGFILFDLLFKV